jgi:hypothetical protein
MPSSYGRVRGLSTEFGGASRRVSPRYGKRKFEAGVDMSAKDLRKSAMMAHLMDSLEQAGVA